MIKNKTNLQSPQEKILLHYFRDYMGFGWGIYFTAIVFEAGLANYPISLN